MIPAQGIQGNQNDMRGVVGFSRRTTARHPGDLKQNNQALTQQLRSGLQEGDPPESMMVACDLLSFIERVPHPGDQN